MTSLSVDETAADYEWGEDVSVLDAFEHFRCHVAPQLPLPGSGATWQRFRTLADWSAQDLSVGRLCEGHSDAIAILHDAGAVPRPGCSYGVWAARGSSDSLRATRVRGGWHLEGFKTFCSGHGLVERALVTAESESGYLTFDVSTSEQVVGAIPGSWPAVGMAQSRSETLEFGGPDLSVDQLVGEPGFYVDRPGLWFGAVGVAACWYGGARGILEHVARGLGPTASDALLAELGAAVADVEMMRVVLSHCASEIDDDPRDQLGQARARALVARAVVHEAAQRVLSASASAGGARPFTLDARQSQRAADLFIYLTQYHVAAGVELGRSAAGL